MATDPQAAGSAVGLVGAATILAAPRLIDLPQDPHGWGLGPYQSTPTLTTLGLLTVVGASLVMRRPGTAAVLLGVATAWIALVVVAEFRPVVFLLTLPVAVSAMLAVHRAADAGAGRVILLAVAIMSIASVGAGVAQSRWLDRYGPTHPESTRPAPDWVAEWMWLGGVSPHEATITAGGLEGFVVLQYWADEGAPGVVQTSADRAGVARFELTDLEPDTEYEYRVVGTAGAPGPAESSFRTPGVGPQSLTVVVGSCARTASNGAVFDTMLDEAPDLYLNVGDLHYANLVSDDPADHIAALGRSVETPAQGALVSSIPTAYVWDDHDFGDNDSDSSSPSRDAVSLAYRRAVPHHGVDPDPAAPISQAFTIGRVRFVMTDTRSMRTADSMLGDDQLEWFIDEIGRASRSHALVVWVNQAPWISDQEPGSDQWGGFPAERRRIAEAVSDTGNLVMVSGDYHMTAIDDGTNSGYAAAGSPGFPVLHAGPLDRPGSAAGGPYSHGVFVDGGQYAKLTVNDTGGSTVRVRMTGNRWDGTELVALELDIEVPSGV